MSFALLLIPIYYHHLAANSYLLFYMMIFSSRHLSISTFRTCPIVLIKFCCSIVMFPPVRYDHLEIEQSSLKRSITSRQDRPSLLPLQPLSFSVFLLRVVYCFPSKTWFLFVVVHHVLQHSPFSERVCYIWLLEPMSWIL